jgi:NADP-dependent 3-hydroxy acid dehydrogenase YdfG
MSQLVWFITGCSSGFGEAFVSEILSRGDFVIATGRNVDKIAHLSQPGVSLLRLDVTDDQKQIDKAVAAGIGIHGRIDVLVNNAGYIVTGSWEDVRYVPGSSPRSQ